MKKWIINQPDKAAAEKLAREAGISVFAAKLLVNRGIFTRDEAEEFFYAEELTPPEELTDMEKAAEVISRAIENNDKITVYGDYDCDGITATVILYGYLEAIGANADWYIPGRDEGYGLNKNAIDKLAADGTKLIITVDNGISAIDEAEYIREKGMTLVITDHHQVPEELPDAAAVVDPHRSDDYSSCKELAGCGVALKLVMALEGDCESVMEQWGDLVAVGTVGDIVPLTGENRILVRRGLESLPFTENRGLHALLRQCGIQEEDTVSAVSLAFSVCPRINAAGRFAHPKEAAELLLSENETMIPVMAERLTMLNAERQQEEKKILEEIRLMAESDPLLLKRRVIIVRGKGWSHGVIGIIASRLLNKFGKPVIVITDEGEVSRGSARSVEGFSLFRMLTALSEHLVKFGGHTKAAGFSVLTENAEEFAEAVWKYAEKNNPEMPADVYTAEMAVTVEELSLPHIESLQYFEPFGEANPNPVLMLPDCTVKSVRPLKDGKYLSFTVDFQHREFKVLDFSSTYKDFGYKAGDKAELLVTAFVNEYGGEKSVNLRLTDIRPAGFSQDRYFAAKNAYERLCLKEPIPASLAKRVIPDRAVQMTVYDIVKLNPSISSAAGTALEKGINYCMFRVVLDLFQSVGILKINEFDGTVLLLPVRGKADIENSPYLTELKQRLA